MQFYDLDPIEFAQKAARVHRDELCARFAVYILLNDGSCSIGSMFSDLICFECTPGLVVLEMYVEVFRVL